MSQLGSFKMHTQFIIKCFNTFTLKTKNCNKNEVKSSISRIENFIQTVLDYINGNDLFDRIYYRKDPLFVIASLNFKKFILPKENILTYHDKAIDNIFSNIET